jgi:hypothetical protein
MPESSCPATSNGFCRRASILAICAGGADAGAIGKLSARERFHWLVSPKSTIVQTSPVHTGQCSDLEAALEHLMSRMIRRKPQD